MIVLVLLTKRYIVNISAEISQPKRKRRLISSTVGQPLSSLALVFKTAGEKKKEPYSALDYTAVICFEGGGGAIRPLR